MKSILNISEAFSLALHSAAMLASEGGAARITAHGIASRLGASEAHLSKVMQRLTRAGILGSSRGPGGGFSLVRPAREITLLELYEGVEGPLRLHDCIMGTRICAGTSCLFDDLIEKVNGQFKDYLENTTLAEIREVIGG